ncbi:MAG: DUF1697 domain-containing protein [Algicola sp.]|nr:DUF1697 domain-containing protein [Algicola sp.]
MESINMENIYIALLRGINVSGQKKIRMADLRQVLEKSGLQNVKTYIQSGNIVFEKGTIKKEDLREHIFDAIRQNFGFDVPTLIIQKEEIEEVLDANPFSDKVNVDKLYYVWLRNSPKQELVEEFNQLYFEREQFHITDKCVYLLCESGYGNAKLNNNYIEGKLKVGATTRNQKTMIKLLEMVSS